MAIKFTTSDGRVFDTHEDAEDHESTIEHLEVISSHIDDMLDANNIEHPANRTRAKNMIELWEVYKNTHDVPSVQADLFEEGALKAA